MNRNLKILEVVFSRSWGGLEMVACNYAKGLQNLGHDVLVVSYPDSPVANYCEDNGVPFSAIKPRLKYLDIFTARKVAKIMRNREIEILHAHISKDLSALALAKIFAGRGKLFFSLHMDTRYRKKDLFHRWIYRHIDMIVTVSKSSRNNVLENTPATYNQVTNIYNGVDTKFFRPPKKASSLRSQMNIPDDAMVVGIVGRLDPLKNQELLIDAAPAVLEKFPNTFFLFVGTETKSKGARGYKELLIQKIKNKRLSSYFKLVDFTKRISEMFSIFDVSILTTSKETFGLVLIEAMATGIPVIGTNAGGVPEIIDDSVNGLLFEPVNADTLGVCIVKLSNDKGCKRCRLIFDQQNRYDGITRKNARFTLSDSPKRSR